MAESENFRTGVERGAQVEMEGFAAFTSKEWWQNDRFITIILFSWLREAKIEIKSEIQLIAQP